MIDIKKCAAYFEENRDSILAQWKEFVSFKTISADPACNRECSSCAAWLMDHLTAMGLESRIIETPSKPIVFAKTRQRSGGPRVLFYGHYDVQPVDPLPEWRSDPFKPEVRGDRLYGRGAQDNKGQAFAILKALEFLLKQNELKCELMVFLEGEEEKGSEGAMAVLPRIKADIKADVLMVCDTGALRPNVPCITMGIRGLLQMEVRISGIHRDLHSGLFGGAVKNPAIELARLLATLHDENGRIAIPHYYDGVRDLSAKERELVNSRPYGQQAFVELVGVPPTGGEKGYSVRERTGIRPTVEVVGLYSGYTGPGIKTIIPAHATAKITSRLVANQDPERCLVLLEEYLKARAPEDLRFEILEKSVCGPALNSNAEAEALKKAAEVASALGSGQVDYAWEGGSIPIVATLARAIGAEPLLVGFSLPEDNMHAPNESFSLSQFKLAFLYGCSMLSKLSE